MPVDHHESVACVPARVWRLATLCVACGCSFLAENIWAADVTVGIV